MVRKGIRDATNDSRLFPDAPVGSNEVDREHLGALVARHRVRVFHGRVPLWAHDDRHGDISRLTELLRALREQRNVRRGRPLRFQLLVELVGDDSQDLSLIHI